jgi:hypothetical protein
MIDIAPEIEASLESPLASFSFSKWRRKVPYTLKDYVPYSLIGLPSHLYPAPPKPVLPAELEVPSLALKPMLDPEPEADTVFIIEPNSFGLYQQYIRKPQTDPEDSLTLADLADGDDGNDNNDAIPGQHHSDAPVAKIPCSSIVDFSIPSPA